MMRTNGNAKVESTLYAADVEFVEELKRELEGYIRLQAEQAALQIMTKVEKTIDQTIEQTLQPVLWELCEQRREVCT